MALNPCPRCINGKLMYQGSDELCFSCGYQSSIGPGLDPETLDAMRGPIGVAYRVNWRKLGMSLAS